MQIKKSDPFVFAFTLIAIVSCIMTYFVSKRSALREANVERVAKEAEAKASKLEQEHKAAKKEIEKQAEVIAKHETKVTESKKLFNELASKYESLKAMPPTPPECVEAVKPYQIALAQADAVIDSAKTTIARLEIVSADKDKQILNLTTDNKRLENLAHQNAIAATNYKAAYESEKSNLWKVRIKSFSIGFGSGFVAGLATGRR